MKKLISLFIQNINQFDAIGKEAMVLGFYNYVTPLDDYSAKDYSKKIVVGADVRRGKIASHGWKKQSETIAIDLIKELNSKFNFC